MTYIIFVYYLRVDSNEKWNDKELILIPKWRENYHQKAHTFLNSDKNDNPNWNIKIYTFKSLTLRALQKLCFKEDKEILIWEQKDRNTFIWNIERELLANTETQNKRYFYKWKLNRFDEFKIYDKYKDKKDWKQDEKLLIEFYQDVLKTKSAKSLDVKDFWLESILDKKFEYLDEFELALEKVAYVKNITKLDENWFEKFKKDFWAFEYKINSQDLSIKDENHKNKKHTNYWLEFWTDENKNKNYDIRINPEFSLYYTLANEDLKDKDKNWLIIQPKKLEWFRNRKLKNQLIFTTNFSLNANEKLQNLAFLETSDLKENINKFNNRLKNNISEKYSKNDLWHFGIDRWINELATLSITKFLDTENKKWVNNFEFAKIECVKLKDEYDKILDIKVDDKWNTKYEFEKLDYTDKNWHKRNFEIAKNVSYFLPQTELFEEVKTWIIDLTQAKLIWDKIVLNWDKSTLLKLKELSAKRRLFELFSKWKIAKNSIIKNWKEIIYITDNDYKQHPIYWLTEEIKKDQKYKLKENILNILQVYLKSLDENNKFEDLETIKKIDHLRDAITSNMVWIIHFLMIIKWYFWKIVLENLDEYKNQKEPIQGWKETWNIEKMIDWHFYQSNTDISRRLEWSLYRKFQWTSYNEIWLVPPEIKQSVFLKDDFWINKFGIIEFVKVWWTSATCPYCNGHFWSKSGLKEHNEKDNCWFKEQTWEYLEFYNWKDINYDSIASFTVWKFSFEENFTKFEENKEIVKYSEKSKKFSETISKWQKQPVFQRSKTLNLNKK